MTNAGKILLVRSVAALESVWRPIRRCDRIAAVYAARQERAEFGGGSGRQRKANERTRAELAADGLLIGGEVLPEGRRLVRRWTSPFGQRALIDALTRIKQRMSAGDCRRDCGVPESLIVGSASSDAFAHLQSIVLPSLADGVLESSCTVAGNCFYSFSSLVSDDDVPEVVAARSVDADSDLDDKLCDVYMAEFRDTWARVMSDRVQHQEIGLIPAIVSMPLESGRGYYDFAGIAPFQSEAAGNA